MLSSAAAIDVNLPSRSNDTVTSTERGCRNCGVDNGGSGASQELVCYGIGNFATSLIARYQLAMFLIFRDELKASNVSALMFIFNSAYPFVDIAALMDLVSFHCQRPLFLWLAFH